MDPQRLQVLDAFPKMRNLTDYRGVPVSEAMAAECGKAPTQPVAEVRAWLAARRAP